MPDRRCLNILARCEYVVKAAEADVVGSAVAGDNPLRTCCDVAFQFNDALAGVATTGFAKRYELVGYLTGHACIVAVVEPLTGESLDFVRTFVAAESGGHKVGQTSADFFGGNLHAQTEFGEVLEERISPCGTVAGSVCRVRCRGNGTGVDRRAAGGVGNHFMIAEELADEFHIRCFAAAGACTGEFEQRCCELAVLDVCLDVYKILL